MTRAKPSGGTSDLPVDPERLRQQFPALTDQDLDAYVTVTRRILTAGPEHRPGLTRELMAKAREARRKAEAGETLSSEEQLLGRYLRAVDKMQSKGR